MTTFFSTLNLKAPILFLNQQSSKQLGNYCKPTFNLHVEFIRRFHKEHVLDPYFLLIKLVLFLSMSYMHTEKAFMRMLMTSVAGIMKPCALLKLDFLTNACIFCMH